MRMLRCSPTGKSLPSLLGIVTSPGLAGCLYGDDYHASG